jgi:hypothetical protein
VRKTSETNGETTLNTAPPLKQMMNETRRHLEILSRTHPISVSEATTGISPAWEFLSPEDIEHLCSK